MTYNRDDYTRAMYGGMVFSNYPLTSGGISDNHRMLEDALEIEGINVFTENRDQIHAQAQQAYGDFPSDDVALFNYFQMNYSAPAVYYNDRQDIAVLYFPVPTNPNSFVQFQLSGQELYEHLQYAVQQSAQLMAEREKAPRNAEYVRQMPVSMIDEVHYSNMKNCEKFSHLMGVSFDLYLAKKQQDELDHALSESGAIDPAVATLYDVQCTDMLGDPQNFDDTHAQAEITRQLSSEIRQNAPRLCN